MLFRALASCKFGHAELITYLCVTPPPESLLSIVDGNITNNRWNFTEDLPFLTGIMANHSRHIGRKTCPTWGQAAFT